MVFWMLKKKKKGQLSNFLKPIGHAPGKMHLYIDKASLLRALSKRARKK